MLCRTDAYVSVAQKTNIRVAEPSSRQRRSRVVGRRFRATDDL